MECTKFMAIQTCTSSLKDCKRCNTLVWLWIDIECHSKEKKLGVVTTASTLSKGFLLLDRSLHNLRSLTCFLLTFLWSERGWCWTHKNGKRYVLLAFPKRLLVFRALLIVIISPARIFVHFSVPDKPCAPTPGCPVCQSCSLNARGRWHLPACN